MLLATGLVAGTAQADDPSGFFGLKFGQPLSEIHIISKDNEDYDFMIRRLDNYTRWHVEYSMAERVIARLFNPDEPMGDDVLQLLENIAQSELGTYYQAVLVEPPLKNELFDVYIVFPTPISNIVGEIRAFGDLDPCAPMLDMLARHLHAEYPALYLLSHNDPHSEDIESIELFSDTIAIRIDCGGFQARNFTILSQMHPETEALMQGVLGAMLGFDRRGL